ncbi:MarR family transcriptional regulator [Streptomyces sp. CT34]|uniref:MarR family winged helix-turn-helix transcriptional regulator n=1 Tax=Streptomyces sp. CT34 TaxID=1553907 RepID=UPI001F529063|nr:MarR family transcriptional regulator [Streptomyces sp. CT34]
MNRSPDNDSTGPALAAIERAMIRIRRSQTRRTLGKIVGERLGRPFDPSHGFVVDALEEEADYPGQQVTVGLVAERLSVDPSRASRLVAAAVEAGYVRRVASQTDSRRICLELSAQGQELAELAHQVRQDYFGALTDDWTDAERDEFARLLTKFTSGLAGKSSSPNAQESRLASAPRRT